jgi:hypothetical protein
MLLQILRLAFRPLVLANVLIPPRHMSEQLVLQSRSVILGSERETRVVCSPVEVDTDGAILLRQEGGAPWGFCTEGRRPADLHGRVQAEHSAATREGGKDAGRGEPGTGHTTECEPGVEAPG